MTDVVEIMARAHVSADLEREPGCWDTPAEEWDSEMLESFGFTAQAEAALSALDAAGYAVVPKEPTEAMLRAAFVDMNATPAGTWKALKAQSLSPRKLFDAKMLPRWKAMIAASSPVLRGMKR